MTTEERNKVIESYGQAYHQLMEAMKELPREMWQFKPAPDRWSIHEIIVHIADSEVNSYIRVRKGIAEPGAKILGYDQDAWATSLDYPHQNIEEHLELFRWLRQTTYHLIKNQPDSVWANTYEHSENGPTTLEEWLHIYERHIPSHIHQMQRNFDIWRG
jgi:uncharacterized damage-inducible protein DinB